jgi:hypothetical protein
MSARTRSKRKPAAAPEEEVSAPSKPAKRVRGVASKSPKNKSSRAGGPSARSPTTSNRPPPEILPAADVKMEYTGKDNGPTTSHEPSLDQEPSHPEANEEPEEDQ